MECEVQVRRTVGGNVEFAVYRCADGYRVVAPGLAAYAVDSTGREVACDPEGGSDAAIDAFRTYKVAPLLGQLRGTPSLHGGGAVIAGKCIAFLGGSGSGKSTLVASLADRFPVLGDDCLEVECVHGMAIVRSRESRIRLWEDSRLRFAHTRPFGDAFGKAAIDLGPAPDRVPLARVYLPEMTGRDVAIERLTSRDALLSLATHAYRLDPSDSRLLALELDFLEQLTARVPVSRVTYPRDFDRIVEVHAAIFADLGR